MGQPKKQTSPRKTVYVVAIYARCTHGERKITGKRHTQSAKLVKARSLVLKYYIKLTSKKVLLEP